MEIYADFFKQTQRGRNQIGENRIAPALFFQLPVQGCGLAQGGGLLQLLLYFDLLEGFDEVALF